ncbi:hypothetical protein DUI87_08810 [Hirundo rustica rustica]|uniref:Uncharacterized protein n=1 Tax=Hirundo rustica rustica TaxID=333673 RepID=A0A3M0KKE5_HIRRU|nr:hypothetical protein DUI87_08810 [Hirundo rustica rustica]
MSFGFHFPGEAFPVLPGHSRAVGGRGMAKGRRQRGRGSGTGERAQLQRNEEVRCSNHDATHKLILSPNGKLSEHWAKGSANCPKTRLVQEMGSQNIVQIACGDQHAMALCRGGELFTWGQNTHGQLGVGSQTTLTPKPQLVERLKGIPLAQIAAGGAHSTTVSLSGAVYSWGKNSFGQLGLGDTKEKGESKKGIKITAGVHQSFVRCKENKNSYLNGIATLEDKEVDAWISNSKCRESIKKNIILIFSSEACINGSFLDKRDKHFKTSKEVSGIDMSEVKRFYEKISKNRTAYQEVQKEIRNLLPSLSPSPISPENFRVYLILPFLLQEKDGDSFLSLILLAQAILKLHPEGLQTLECLWSNLETSFFKELVNLYQSVSQQVLFEFFLSLITTGPGRLFNLDPAETGPLQILQMLYQVNSRTGFRVHESNFHIPQVREIINLCSWFNIATVLWKLSKYPCIFDRENKILVHRTECSFLSRTSPVSAANFATN